MTQTGATALLASREKATTVDGLDDIVEEFLVESHENLDQLDSDLVALEQDPESRERLSSIFRTIHTIKGTSGFLAFNRLEEVTHVGENMLSRLRDGELELTPTRTSVLLQMVDTVRSLLTSIEATGGEGPVDVSAVVAAISAAMEDTPAAPAAPAPQAKAPAKKAAAKPAAKEAPARKAAAPVPQAPAATTLLAPAPELPAHPVDELPQGAQVMAERTTEEPAAPDSAPSPTAPSASTSTCSTS
jgi:two-component system chemotaxis sensor kinase CheA